MAKGNIKVVQLKTQKELHDIAGEWGSIRGGGTQSPEERARGYERQGYSGTMFVAPTTNLMLAEDKLLQNNDFRHNQHQQSNLGEEEGYIYVIQGKKSQTK
jgi:hypothetical protein